MKQHLIYLFMLVASLIACSDDDNLTPSERTEFGYTVPQGDHEYDDRIVDWNKRCNTFILYKFDLKELYWQVSSWNESKPQPEGSSNPYNSGLVAEVADEAYVGEQLDLIESLFLDFYQDTTLYRCLPLKLLLCGRLDERTISGAIRKSHSAFSGYDYLAFNWGNENVLTLTDMQKKTFKNEVNNTFLTRLLDNGKIVIDPAFYEGMNYTSSYNSSTMYERGFLKTGIKQENDAKNYIEVIISNTYEDLIAENTSTSTNIGILNPAKDKNGYIRKKYDVLVNSFKANYGIDLQAIGNTVLK